MRPPVESLKGASTPATLTREDERNPSLPRAKGAATDQRQDGPPTAAAGSSPDPHPFVTGLLPGVIGLLPGVIGLLSGVIGLLSGVFDLLSGVIGLLSVRH